MMAIAPSRQIPAAKSPPRTQGALYFEQLAVNHDALWNRVFDWLVDVTGTNTITAGAEGPPVEVYGKGMGFWFIPAAANTGPVTINVSGAGARDLRDIDGEPLKAGDLVPTRAYGVIFTGVHLRVVTSSGSRLATDAEISAGSGAGLLDVTRGMQLLSAQAPSAAAEYITEWNRTSSVSSVVFGDLGGYRNLYVHGYGVQNTGGASRPINLLLSPNAGTTWRSAVTLGDSSLSSRLAFAVAIRDLNQVRRSRLAASVGSSGGSGADTTSIMLPADPGNVEAHDAIQFTSGSSFNAGQIVLWGDR
jgi:hypothetical protein